MSTLTATTPDLTTLVLRIPDQVTAPPRLTERLPALYPWAVRAHRVRRHLAWLRSDAVWAADRDLDRLPVRVKRHSSLLMRELSEAEMVFQRNKVVNLRLASDRVHGLLIRPGETFSFNKVVGSCTRRKGYVEGMRLSTRVRRSLQLANPAGCPHRRAADQLRPSRTTALPVAPIA